MKYMIVYKGMIFFASHYSCIQLVYLHLNKATKNLHMQMVWKCGYNACFPELGKENRERERGREGETEKDKKRERDS